MSSLEHCDQEFREIVEATRQFVKVFPEAEASFRIDEHTTVTVRGADLLKEVEAQTEIGQRFAAILKKLAEDTHMSIREFIQTFFDPDYAEIVGCCGADCKTVHSPDGK